MAAFRRVLSYTHYVSDADANVIEAALADHVERETEPSHVREKL